MDVRIILPLHSTSRGSPTLTDKSFMILLSLHHEIVDERRNCPGLKIKSRRLLKLKGHRSFRSVGSNFRSLDVYTIPEFLQRPRSGLRLVSVLLPLSEQRELVRGPIG